MLTVTEQGTGSGCQGLPSLVLFLIYSEAYTCPLIYCSHFRVTKVEPDIFKGHCLLEQGREFGFYNL